MRTAPKVATKTKRYRMPRGPRFSPRSYRIVNRRGEYLWDDTQVPLQWTKREMMALSFRDRQAAERFVRDHFVSEVSARELLGIRVV